MSFSGGREAAAWSRSKSFTQPSPGIAISGSGLPVKWRRPRGGTALARAVEEHGPLPLASLLALAAGLAEGLEVVHQAGVIHRDLKPSNVLLAADGPRLIDFGISQAADFAQVTVTGMVIGTPGFMSPEQARGDLVGPPGDMFSLGAVLAFAATAEGPFGSGSPAARQLRVLSVPPRLDNGPAELRPFLERCMAGEPAGRLSAEQFLAELVTAYPAAADHSDWLPPGIRPADSSPEEDARCRCRPPPSGPLATIPPRFPAGSRQRPPFRPESRRSRPGEPSPS
jgi:serine/threonine protein kinase